MSHCPYLCPRDPPQPIGQLENIILQIEAAHPSSEQEHALSLALRLQRSLRAVFPAQCCNSETRTL